MALKFKTRPSRNSAEHAALSKIGTGAQMVWLVTARLDSSCESCTDKNNHERVKNFCG